MIKPWSYKRNQLYFDEHLIQDLAELVTTPFYLYSEKNLEHYWFEFSQAALEYKIPNPKICYALKANPNPFIVKKLKKLGAGADVVSAGELKRALECHISPENIVFSGVGKTQEEIDYALSLPKELFSFNVESIEECLLIQKLSEKKNKIARIAIRLNPRVKAKTHKHISTGNREHKFGIAEEDLEFLVKKIQRSSHLKLVGFSIHIGSQLTCLKATERAIRRLCQLIKNLSLKLEFIDVGGGLGVNYEDHPTPTSSEYMHLVSQTIQKNLSKEYLNSKNFSVVFEPGRFLVARSGVLITKVIRIKKNGSVSFAIVDGAMNDFARPSLYSAYHQILPLKKRASKEIYDVVGPVCESTDVFAKDRNISKLKANDLLLLSDAGAYGASMASTYNLRKMVQEYLLTKKGRLKKIS